MTETMILKGKPVAELNKNYCMQLIEENKLKPKLVVFLIGNDSASDYYVSNIQKQGKKLNIDVFVEKFDSIEENELCSKISLLNNDNNIHGIMVQKPLPQDIDSAKIESLINPEKDVDGFHPLNAGLMLQEKDCFLPCTAQAILEMMDYYQINPNKKHVVVVGRSNVVGKPIANLLLYKNKSRSATVTVCHSQTPDLSVFTKQADILITAVGVANLINADMIKNQAVILDAGMNEVVNSDSKTIYVGDVNYEDCYQKCNAITPVPGGIGSVTTTILFKNICESALKIKKNKKIVD